MKVVSGQLHAPAASRMGRSSRYPLKRTLGGPQKLNVMGNRKTCPCIESIS